MGPKPTSETRAGCRPSTVALFSAAAGMAIGLFIGIRSSKQTRTTKSQTTTATQDPVQRRVSAAGNKVAVVTGGSRGIGAATCKKLATAGYAVAVVYQHNSSAADAVVSEIVGLGGTAQSFQCNVGSEAEVTALFASVKSKLGPVTALVNNAGIIGNRTGKLDNQGVDDILPVFAVNTFGPFICCREAAKQMSTERGGSGGAIVNISSGSALIGTPLVYAMSKGALNSMSTGIRDELIAQGIRINSISPGLTNTSMVNKEMAEKIIPGIPMKRMGTPEEIAAVAVWLLSDEASYVCGAHIRVAGGRRMGCLQ